MWLGVLVLLQVTLLVGIAIGRLSAQGRIRNAAPVAYVPSRAQLRAWRKERS